ncbi:MAG TPA: XRE family transcriptional regulator [Planctomycetaceae bacterium]|nr:XRE family transcriptional regulator [Planctomycetaceae bacterium]HIQ22964.1 XRE family transcriptional regulator [Planctomycetota bacterium]
MGRTASGKIRLTGKPREIHSAVTEAIRAEIARQNLTYYRIAKDTGISPSALSRFSRPDGTLSAENLLVLLDYLGIDLVSRDGMTPDGASRIIYRAQSNDCGQTDSHQRRRPP